MKNAGQKQTLYQTRRGITLKEGFYLTMNPATQKISIVSIIKGVVFVHEVTRQMDMTALVQLDAAGYLEVIDELLPVKTKTKKEE